MQREEKPTNEIATSHGLSSLNQTPLRETHGADVLIQGVPASLAGDFLMSRNGEIILKRIYSGRPDVLALGRPVAKNVGVEIRRVK